MKDEKPAVAIPEASALILLSSITYASAYFFERGYLSYFGISVEFATVGADQILYCIQYFSLPALFILLSVHDLHQFYKCSRNKKIQKVAIVVLSAFLCGYAIFRPIDQEWWTFFAWFGFFILILYRLLSASDHLFLSAKNKPAEESFIYKAMCWLGFGVPAVGFLILVLGYTIPISSQRIGYIAAQSKSTFPTTEIKNKHYIIVRNYSGQKILSQFSFSKMENDSDQLTLMLTGRSLATHADIEVNLIKNANVNNLVHRLANEDRLTFQKSFDAIADIKLKQIEQP